MLDVPAEQLRPYRLLAMSRLTMPAPSYILMNIINKRTRQAIDIAKQQVPLFASIPQTQPPPRRQRRR